MGFNVGDVKQWGYPEKISDFVVRKSEAIGT